MVLIVLVSQPLVQSYLGYKSTHESVLALLSFVFLGIFIWAFWRIFRSEPGQFYSSVGSKGHLVWHDSKSKGSILGSPIVGSLYLLGLFIPLLFMAPFMTKGLPLLIVGAATAIYSLFFAGKEEFGSYWCFTAVAYAIVALFV
jgi:hypothetical protein